MVGKFQSTRPVWGATWRPGRGRPWPCNFNPRAPCGARPGNAKRTDEIGVISIHAPRVGRDRCRPRRPAPPRYFNPRAPCGARLSQRHCPPPRSTFQSTRPVWGATRGGYEEVHQCKISIHAPRVGRDHVGFCLCTATSISIHAPRVGRDGALWQWDTGGRDFNPRAPCGARRPDRPRRHPPLCISIHAPRVGRDCTTRPTTATRQNFNPRAPCGARRHQPTGIAGRPTYFNPRAPCGARRPGGRHVQQPDQISIHAPRVGRDHDYHGIRHQRDISIHAPRVGRDDGPTDIMLNTKVFQSTRPVWGATCTAPFAAHSFPHFNPRAPCGARLMVSEGGSQAINISIHAPRVGRDEELGMEPEHILSFQSTRPVWGATSRRRASRTRIPDFNPRAPCGARRRGQRRHRRRAGISIHAPRVGRDSSQDKIVCALKNFNPRAPCGARRSRLCLAVQPREISIHAPRVGRDHGKKADKIVKGISIHAPRVGRDQRAGHVVRRHAKGFQSTRPVWGATSPARRCRSAPPQFQSTRPVWGATSVPSASIGSQLFQSTRPVWGATSTI